MKQLLTIIIVLIALSTKANAQNRYFMAGYFYTIDTTDDRTAEIFGGIGFSTKQKYPSMKGVIKIIRCANGVDKKRQVIILSIYEFKNQAEYNAFFEHSGEQTVDLDNPMCN